MSLMGHVSLVMVSFKATCHIKPDTLLRKDSKLSEMLKYWFLKKTGTNYENKYGCTGSLI